MNVLLGVISPAPVWVMPRRFVHDLRHEFPRHTFLDAWDQDTINRYLPDADVAFTPTIDRKVFPLAKRLKWIQSPAAGIGSLMFPELHASHVVITSARGIRARSIAEHVIGVTIALARRLPHALRAQAAHRWAQDELDPGGRGPRSEDVPGGRAPRSEDVPGGRAPRSEDVPSDMFTLCGRRMGIVGLGSIGCEIAKLALPFGLKVSGIRRRPGTPSQTPLPDVEVYGPDQLLGVLSTSDIVVLSLPHTPDTRQIIGSRELDRMKRGALLINIARGKLVDDEAVVKALREGRLGGAALDVFTREPLEASSPYWDLPNVIITPHTSGAMDDYWTPLVALFSDNLRRFERGEPLLNVVDKQAGY